MNALTKAKLLIQILKWRATWSRRNIDLKPPKKLRSNPKFITAREFAKRIPDGSVCMSSGMAGNTRCSIFFWAIKEVNAESGHPKDLTWITVGAQGGRGRVPGTMEEMNAPGLVTHYIGGHVETAKAILKNVDKGYCDIQVLPQGQQTFQLEAQARGEEWVTAHTGVGTFLDPRVGTGPNILGTAKYKLVEADGDKLRYRMPKIEVAVFTAPAADEEGNIYITNACMFTEARESTYAAHANGGKVYVSVSQIVPKNEKEIFLPADKIDAIIYNPANEQTGSVPQYRYWDMFTLNSKTETDEGIRRINFINSVLKLTPQRGQADDAVARLAASVFTRIGHAGIFGNIGVGMPEEVSRLLYESGLAKDITFSTEVGVVGGIPARGIFFGAAVNPKEMISSAEVFKRYYKSLEIAMFGQLEVDSEGNVNVSRRGEGAYGYVGPGGLPDIAESAKTILFIGSWMAKAHFSIVDGKLKIDKSGPPKFVEKVREITFSGKEALKAGKIVYYITNIGVFKLTERGMLLDQVMPGIDIQKDIIAVTPMKVILPDGPVPVVSDDIVTGRNFKLSWGK